MRWILVCGVAGTLAAADATSAQPTAPSDPPAATADPPAAPAAPAAGGPAVQGVLDRIAGAEKTIATVRFPFVQEKHLAILDQPLITDGSIEIDRKLGAVRWEFTGKSVMIFAKGRLRRYGAGGKLEGTGDDPNLKPFQDQMQAFVSGDWSSLKQAFTLAGTAGTPSLELTPRSAQLARYISHITIRFRDDYSAPLEMTMTAAGGDQTIYRFGEPQAGVQFPHGRFDKP